MLPRGNRRRPTYTASGCAITAALLLLITVYFLYSRLVSTPLSPPSITIPNPILDYDFTDPTDIISRSEDDRIDETDNDPEPPNEDEDEEDEEDGNVGGDDDKESVVDKFRFDHVEGVIRRVFEKTRSIDQWDDDDFLGFRPLDRDSGIVFGSDDVAVDENVRRKVVGVRNVEDALLLKGSGLREGWGKWFEAKSDFLRRDRMFRSNLEGLNPLNNPMLQDPDGAGLTGLTKGDRVVMKGLLHEFKKVPFLVKKSLSVGDKSGSDEIEIMEKPLIVKSSENGLKKGREIASMKKPLVIKSLENEVDDLIKIGRGIASIKMPPVVKSPKIVVEDASTNPVVKNSLEIGVEGREHMSTKNLLVFRNLTVELEMKPEHESKALEGSTEDSHKSSGSLVSFKTEEMSTMKKPLVIKNSTLELGSNSNLKHEVIGDGGTKLISVHDGDVSVVPKPLERRALHEKVSNLSSGALSKHIAANVSNSNTVRSSGSTNVKANAKTKQVLSREVYANGKRWGFFPGLHPRLSFSNFMDAFFRKGKCSMRVFMVWNSPPWSFTVRHQRGLESLLFHHSNACLVVFSETIELNFFKEFVKEGFKVAVAMPNLDELLKDTPTHEFASVWFEWRETSFYSTHYSELIRLAALYKYGGIYLDSDVIVLRPLSSFSNSVGLVDPQAETSLNGAVMSFRKHSPFIMECLTEFYSSYDDTKLTWNGADLLTRVANNFSRSIDVTDDKIELKVQYSSLFFPISRDSIRRYFSAPETEIERAEQNQLFAKILKESFTFHFWNSLTSALVPEPESLVARIINHNCIRCDEVL